MEAVYQAARAWGGQTLWLAVWEDNPRALAFYRKCGFVAAGREDFWLGSVLQQDHVMTLALRDTVPSGG